MDLFGRARDNAYETEREVDMLRRLAVLVVGLTWATAAPAQVAVQQPVIDVFSVDTVVSVPDRGAATLGGVRQSGSGRSTAGPFRSGTAWGQASAASSASTHVWIHDFEAMDAALLAEGSPDTTAPVTRADRAQSELARQQAMATGRPASPAVSLGIPRPLPRSLPGASASLPSLRPVRPQSTRPAADLRVQPLQYNLIR